MIKKCYVLILVLTVCNFYIKMSIFKYFSFLIFQSAQYNKIILFNKLL